MDITTNKEKEKEKSQERGSFGAVLWNSVRTSLSDNKGAASKLERTQSLEDVTEVRDPLIFSHFKFFF